MSEKEMLLLSNYVYMDISTDEMSIGDSIDRFRNSEGGFDGESVAKAGIGGGLSRDEAADLFKRIDEMPDDFKNLYPSKILNDEDVRGVCYTQGKSDTGEACVVFRGTGGTYEAWHDNVLGQCRVDTAIQMQAADWVDNECALYSSLQVCGHSKGGNLAMYTTVVSSAAVTSCVSFDGQGFSQDFLNAYPDEIAVSSGKIKSVSAHNDFVNILLNPIAGETVYTENEGKGVNAHSSYYMLISNEYDENGNIISTKKQSVLSRTLDELADGVAMRLNMLPGSGNEDFTGLLAALVAGIISSDKSKEYEQGRVAESTLDVGEYLLSGGLLNGNILRGNSLSGNLSGVLDGGLSGRSSVSARSALSAIKLTALVNETKCDGLKRSGSEIEDVGKAMQGVGSRLDEMIFGTDTSNRIDCYIRTKIDGIKDRLDENIRGIFTYSDTIRDIGRMYALSEAKVGEYMA